MTAPAAIGHNNGPTIEPGAAWRRFAWARARADLLPHLPLEVLRLRVKRAQELGLPYRTYASVRASTGHDVIGFLFPSNALRLLRTGDALPPDRAARLASLVATSRLALVHRPLPPEAALATGLIERAGAAPTIRESWSAMRDRVAGFLREGRLPADGYLVVGETALEREWAEAGRTAGFLPGARFFGAAV